MSGLRTKLWRVARTIALAAVLLGNLLLGALLYSQESDDIFDSPYEKIARFTRILESVRESYVDASKVGYGDLLDGALQGMLQSLDPHSHFLDADAFRSMKDDTEGQFGGVGLVISMRGGLLTVVSAMEGTPAFRVGLLPGDMIVEVDGKPTEGLSIHDCSKQLRGAPGTRVQLKIVRPPEQEIRALEIVREEIHIDSVQDARLMADGLGYLRITQFSEPTAVALQESLDKLRRQGLRGLILDLRNNPGGLLSSAVEVSQKFLPRGALIVYTQGRTKAQYERYTARGRVHYERASLPMVILVNEGSASASEIVAGALQDHRRAILVGQRTFGKGSVQSLIPLDDGAAIRLTTAKYYTPSQRVIHEHGIEPDIVVPMSLQSLHRLDLDRARWSDAESAEEEAGPSAEDVQLQRAMDVLRGILLFEARAGRRT